MNTKMLIYLTIATLLSCAGCSSFKPKDVNNVCEVLADEDWYESAMDTQKKWGTPIHVLLAIMHQESKFTDDLRPERTWYLGFIPGPIKSSAYGYAQALDETWEDYIKITGNTGADRDDFDDAIDFIGWYTSVSHSRLGLSKWDAELQYLAYHEGWGGYSRKTYKHKAWLIKVAKKVKKQSLLYATQYKKCQTELENKSSWF